jgi:hypothetical protein
MLVFMSEREPAVFAVVLSVGPTAARVGIMPAADSFTCESGHFVKEEERALDAGVVALLHLKDVSASNARTSVFGYPAFGAFGVVGYGASFQKAGFPSAFRWGDPCELEEGYSLKCVPADVQFTFSGVVKTTNGARSVVLLCALETAHTIGVLPYGVISMHTGVAPAEPRDHMATLQRVRCSRAAHRMPRRTPCAARRAARRTTARRAPRCRARRQHHPSQT